MMRNLNTYEYLKGENLSKHIKVGQTVYIVVQNNYARHVSNPYESPKREVVSKVGRKYFYIRGKRDKFGEDCGEIRDIHDYSNNYKIFLTIEDFANEKLQYELSHVGDSIKSLFHKMDVSDQLMLRDLVDKYRNKEKLK